MLLQSNAVSHWLSANLESALLYFDPLVHLWTSEHWFSQYWFAMTEYHYGPTHQLKHCWLINDTHQAIPNGNHFWKIRYFHLTHCPLEMHICQRSSKPLPDSMLTYHTLRNKLQLNFDNKNVKTFIEENAFQRWNLQNINCLSTEQWVEKMSLKCMFQATPAYQYTYFPHEILQPFQPLHLDFCNMNDGDVEVPNICVNESGQHWFR